MQRQGKTDSAASYSQLVPRQQSGDLQLLPAMHLGRAEWCTRKTREPVSSNPRQEPDDLLREL